MTPELIERLTKAIPGKVHEGFYRKPNSCMWYLFDPENDSDLLKRCLTELMNDGWDLNVYRPNDNRYSKSYSMESSTRNTADFKTLEEAIYTAFCEMKEDER